MLRIITGQRGAGKTYLMVREMALRRRREPKRYFATNIDVNESFRKLMGDRLIEVDYSDVGRFWRSTPAGSAMYLDEGTAHFDARNWSETIKAAPDITGFLSHLRKSGDELHLIAHEPGMIDKRVRQYCDVFDWCMSTRLTWRLFGINTSRFEWFYRATYQDEKMRSCVGGEWVRRQQWVCELYDSYAVSTAGNVERLALSELQPAVEEVGESPKPARGRRWPWVAAAAAAGLILGGGL